MSSKGYYLKVRAYPTSIMAVPFILFSYYMIYQVYGNAHNIHFAWLLLGKLGSDAGFLFLSVQINRFVGKEFIHRFAFKGKLKQPIINFLLLKDTSLPLAEKLSIRQAIATKYNIVLPELLEEMANESRARYLIGCAVSKIKYLLQADENVLRHEMEYKFMRNLIGGSIHGIVFSAINIYLGYLHHDIVFMTLGFCCIIPCYFLLLFSKKLLVIYSEYYAWKLYQAFMNAQ